MFARLRPIIGGFLRRTGIDFVLRRYDLDFWRPYDRDYCAQKYLRGEGIEIGALHQPQRLPPGVKVVYIDQLSYEECIERFPELDSSSIVRPTVVEDGFHLASITDESQDFLIAHHVLEHSPNPVQMLLNWGRVLKKGGIMLISVPPLEISFDAGRELTSIEHLLEDFELYKSGITEEIFRRNKKHYEEWFLISTPAHYKEKGKEPLGLTKDEVLQLAERCLRDEIEIHFHTFTHASLKDLLKYFCTYLDRRFSVLVCTQSELEIIGVLEKKL